MYWSLFSDFGECVFMSFAHKLNGYMVSKVMKPIYIQIDQFTNGI